MMPDYKEIYLEMVRGTERAIKRRCEEMYMDASEPEITLLPVKNYGEDEQKTAPDM